MTTTQTSHTQSAGSYRHAQGRRTNRPRNRTQKKHDSPPNNDATPEPPSTENDKKGTSNDEGYEGKEELEDATGEKDDADICWICAESVKFYSLSECNHRTCHVCALRLRALYKKTDCTFCKHPQCLVIFTSSPSSQFEDYKTDEMPYKDLKLSIAFETQEMMEETLILLRFNCPDEDCPFIARGWNDLKVHVRGTHGKQLCDLCLRMKKVFSHEHTLYTSAQLQVHLPSLPQRGKGASKDKEVPEGGIHPLCEFCKDCFFSEDEIFSHMRERHEECFICKRQGIRDQYFLDYASLESHFSNAHYPCTQPACQAQKFVVFGSIVDLKAHMVEQHGASMSAKDIKEARRLETNFEFSDNRGAGTRRRERDRETDSNREAPSRAIVQQNRPLDRRREGFGGTLTGQSESESNAPAVQGNGRSSPSPGRNIDPETARRHAAFMGRVAQLTSNSSAAETSVRSAIRSFRASESTARDVVSTFYNLVNRDLEATASLIAPLVDLLDDEGKRKELLETFNGFKIEQRQQFPDLIPGGQGSAYAGVASGRVLNVKHSTQPRRNAGQIWDRVARAATSSSSVPAFSGSSSRLLERFPALPRASPAAAVPSNTVIPAFRQQQKSTPWSSSSSSAAVIAPAATNPRTFSVKVNESSSRPATALSRSAFPSLPSAAPRVKPPMSGNKSLRNIVSASTTATNAWNASNEDPTVEQTTEGNTEEGINEEPQQPRKGKRKGKEKVTLFTLGTFPT
ncbi:hypothetical protein ACEPAI_5077 [Sanghuangporus weigelae]